jgi:uncharacterized membrane protein YbaN (DUF454 family)
MQDKLNHQLFVVAGTISLVIGVAGIFIPVLPTTPFLLLAVACYLRGSHKLYHALLRHRILGTYIKNYLGGLGMPLKMKIWTLSLLWISIICTALFTTDNLIVRMILAAVLTGVTIHIVSIKTAKQQ